MKKSTLPAFTAVVPIGLQAQSEVIVLHPDEAKPK